MKVNALCFPVSNFNTNMTNYIVKRSPKYTSRRNQTIEVTKNKYKPLPVKYQDNSLNISVNSRHYF